jgi:hypothetical protein
MGKVITEYNNVHIWCREPLKSKMQKCTYVALFTKIITIKNCRKCKTKIKKSFTIILTIILSVKIVLTLRLKLPCRKCKSLTVIFVLSFIVSEKIEEKHWRFGLKIREQISAFSLTV